MIEKEKQIIDKSVGKFKVEVFKPIKKLKWNIKINQRAIIENGIKINLKDAAIFDYIFTYIGSDSAQKYFISGEVYHWVAYQAIIDGIPLLEIENKEIIGRHVKKLVEVGLLDKYVDKKGNSKTYFKIGNVAKNIFFGDAPEPKELPTYPIVDTYLPDSRNLPTEKSDNSYLNSFPNTNTNEKDKIDIKEHLDRYIEDEEKRINNDIPIDNITPLSKQPLKEKERKTSAKKKEKILPEVIEVVQYFNDKMKTKYRPNNKADLTARINEGYSVDDCKQVIDKKAKDKYFIDNPQYLNLTTLFRPSNFERYLNEVEKIPQEKADNHLKKYAEEFNPYA